MPASDRSRALKRIGVIVAIAGALVFAVQGGEFGTLDLLRLGREQARIQRSIDSVQRVVDSLKRYEDKVKNDPATQERIAREVFGMVRGGKEVVYRFADSTGKR